jgi:hypothetical protein
MESYQDTKKLKTETTFSSINPSLVEVLDNDVWTILGPYMYEAYKNTICFTVGESTMLPMVKGGIHYVSTRKRIAMFGVKPSQSPFGIKKTRVPDDKNLHRLKYFCHMRCELMLVCKKFSSIFSKIKVNESLSITSVTILKVLSDKSDNANLLASVIKQVSLITTSFSKWVENERVDGFISNSMDSNALLNILDEGMTESERYKKIDPELRRKLTPKIVKRLRSLKHLDIQNIRAMNCPVNSVFKESVATKISTNTLVMESENVDLSLLKNLRELRIYLNDPCGIVPNKIPSSVRVIELYRYEDDYEDDNGRGSLGDYFTHIILRAIKNLSFVPLDVFRINVRSDADNVKCKEKGLVPNLTPLMNVRSKRLEIYYDDTNYYTRWCMSNGIVDEILFEFDMTDVYLGYADDHKQLLNQNLRAYANAIYLCKTYSFKKVIFSMSNNHQISIEYPVEKIFRKIKSNHFELRLDNAPLNIFDQFHTQLQPMIGGSGWWIVKSDIRHVYDFKNERGRVIKMCYAELVAVKNE